MSLVLPQTTVNLINGVVPEKNPHPGLQMDKFSVPDDQVAQKAALATVCKIPGDSALLTALMQRRKRLLGTLPSANSFSCKTTSPLTLHLARTSSLENAGICLHPIYGFAYLPGSGLKGMARAFAETVWLPAQPDKRQAWKQIENVFGWAPGSDKGKDWKLDGIPERAKDDNARVGSIVFHDAWPESWPQLVVDIVNNHHPNYYQANSDDNSHPPGDWESPVPVYFLAVKPGTTFSFPIAKRRDEVSDDLLSLARQWLLSALSHLGAGAKTAAGYGAFKPVSEDAPALPSEKRATFEPTLELITPAFLAGASQHAEDCELRSATLRGLLRWWWRTMHAGFVDVKTLRTLEAAIWGDMRGGGAVRVVIEKVNPRAPCLYDKKSKASFDKNAKKSDHGVPGSDPDKTTQGLWYASFGMDETSKGQRKQRHYLEPGASWRLRLIARPTCFFANRRDAADPKRAENGQRIAAQEVLSQAQAALWLLCYFGAAGSKARKGFGSMTADGFQGYTQESCREAAKQLRQQLRLSSDFSDACARSPALQQMLDPVEVVFTWPDIWSVLDQVGFAYQAFAKKYKHRCEKMALGLPRRIGNPVRGTFNPTPPVTAHSRHASPTHIHVGGANNGWTVRVIAFPAAHLPNLATSRAFLEEFLKDFGDDLRRRSRLSRPSTGPIHRAPSLPRQAGPASEAFNLPNPGDRVEAVLLEEKTKNGGWRAKHLASDIGGPIQNTADVPGDKKAGDTLALIVFSVSANQREIAFRYPTVADEQRAKRSQNKAKGSPQDRRRHGRR